MTDSSLSRSIREMAEDYQGLLILPLAALESLAERHKAQRRAIEIAALESGVVPLRYARNIGTIGVEGQLALLQANVAVVGAGGLGGNVIEGLARSGVGALVVIDGDVFEEHNLNRQLLSAEAVLGRSKAEVAAERVTYINPAVTVRKEEAWLTVENAATLLRGAEVLVDALDNLPDRLLLQEAAGNLGIPLVHGAIAGFTGQVMTILPGDRGLRALYQRETVPRKGLEQMTGTPAATPMLIAALQVQEVVKIITGTGELLRHCLLVVDGESNEWQRLGIPDG